MSGPTEGPQSPEPNGEGGPSIEDVPDVPPPQVPPPPTPEETEEERRGVTRRIRKIAIGAYFPIAAWYLIHADWGSFGGLTCSAAVAIINFLWLEGLVVKVLRPAPRVNAWRMVVRSLARFILFGVALSVVIIVARFNAISVLLGFSIIVIGIMGEACYEAWNAKE
ncbi:MAG: hypothetical protein WBX15_17835 [Thermoanaerobaculia bacterium]